MSFTRTRLPGFWTFGSAVLPGEFEHIDDYAYAIDGKAGGTYAPTGLITIGGLGLTVSGPFIASDADTIDVNGALTINPGAQLNLDDNMVVGTGAVVGFTSGSFLTVQSGATATFNSGSTLTLSGAATLGATGTWTTAVGSVSTFNGTVTFNSLLTLTKGLAVTQSTANTAAITATGNGTGAGANLTGGATAPGVVAVNGTAQTNTAPTCAGQFAGYVQLTGTTPNQGVDPGANNVLHKSNICHARCTVQVGPGGPYTPDSSYNIDTVTDVGTGIYQVTMKRQLANNKYTAIASCNDWNYDARVTSKGVLVVTVSVVDALTRVLDGATVTLELLVFGEQ